MIASDPERRTGEKLDDAIVNVARKREARARRCALLDRGEQRIAVEHRSRARPSSSPSSRKSTERSLTFQRTNQP